ncbi:MAG: DUF3127 domain-containing protein [Bacteroidales bacterium]|jgi:hypothetical protein|nr:DUF3127 domain-containing protein [Bacteroidales bacterium]
MEITGKLYQKLAEQSGTSARGEWRKQDFIIETEEQYPKKVCISNWNNKVDLDSVAEGTTVTASINIESREFNGRWYTDVKVWRMSVNGQGGTPPPPDMPDFSQMNDAPPANNNADQFAPQDDDLPF